MATPGSLLPGGFVLGRLSHADRVGLVYRAHHTEQKDGRAASALVLHPLHVEELREWFEKMAVLGRSLRHPHLIEVYALGYTANELPVVVTEWVDGKTARNELAAGRIFTPAEVARIVREVASALDYLHRRTPPVLHRVIMPESVLLSSPSESVKLLCVGYADRPQHPAARPSYLSPEELGNEANLSPQSDVFSLASLAYELLTGQVAFNGNAHAILAAIYRGAWPRLAPSEGADDVEAVLQSAWQTDPSKRPASAGAFAEKLSAALGNLVSVSAANRRTATGAMRAPTFPATNSAQIQSPTGRFAAASFHAESIRASRPMAVVARNGASSWSPAPSPSVASSLLVSSTSAYAVAASRMPAGGALSQEARVSSPSPTGSWEVPRGAGNMVEMNRVSSEEDALLAEEITLPGDRVRGPLYTRPANDDGPAPGSLDEMLQRMPRLVETDDPVTVGAMRLAPRKDPLFVPVEGHRASNDVWAIPGGIRRNSGEYPPAQPRPTGEFPHAGGVAGRRATGEFAPARRPTGEFPPATAHARRTGEFAQARRGTGELAPSGVLTARRTGEFASVSTPTLRRTGEFASVSTPTLRRTGEFASPSVPAARRTGESTPAAPAVPVSARRTGEFTTAAPPSNPPRRAVSDRPPHRAIAELPAGDGSNAATTVPLRAPFERDAFAPVPEHRPPSVSQGGRGEFRVTWPVVFAFLFGNTALTGVIVYGLAHLSARTPAVVYVERPPSERPSAFDPVPELSSRTAVQTTDHTLPASSHPIDALAPTVATPSTALEAPAPAPPSLPVPDASLRTAAPSQVPVRPTRTTWRRPPVVPRTPMASASHAAQAPSSAPTVPPVPAATAPPPSPPVLPSSEARPTATGFGEPPPNPY